MSKKKTLTYKEYWWLRDRIEELLEPFRDSDELCADVTRTIIQAGVAEACVLFGPKTARDFISRCVNDWLALDRQQERKRKKRDDDEQRSR
jgi:hypothetical protein